MEKSLNLKRRFSSRCFQDHNLHPRVRGFVYVFCYIFFPSDKFLSFLFVLKRIICTPKLWNKTYRSPCSFKSKTPSYLCISIIVGSNLVLGMRALIRKELWVIHNLRPVLACMIDLCHIYNVANFYPILTHHMRRTGCAVQY